MGEKAWKDPIVEEVRKVRKELDKELERDPQGFMKRARERAIKLGFTLVPAPSSKKKTAGSRKK